MGPMRVIPARPVPRGDQDEPRDRLPRGDQYISSGLARRAPL